jgi:hypothetical protein
MIYNNNNPCLKAFAARLGRAGGRSAAAPPRPSPPRLTRPTRRWPCATPQCSAAGSREASYLRAPSQTGFRSDYRGTANALVLNALKEHYSHARAPLYVAFGDFRKAFDSAPRAQLWRGGFGRSVS